MKQYSTINAYISDFPKDARVLLKKLRATIRKAAPGAKEGISYGMPVFKQNGYLVYIGGFKNHVSLFPGSTGIKKFKKELRKFAWSKGTIKFPLRKKIPSGLVAKIVKFRVKENLAKKK